MNLRVGFRIESKETLPDFSTLLTNNMKKIALQIYHSGGVSTPFTLDESFRTAESARNRCSQIAMLLRPHSVPLPFSWRGGYTQAFHFADTHLCQLKKRIALPIEIQIDSRQHVAKFLLPDVTYPSKDRAHRLFTCPLARLMNAKHFTTSCCADRHILKIRICLYHPDRDGF